MSTKEKSSQFKRKSFVVESQINIGIFYPIKKNSSSMKVTSIDNKNKIVIFNTSKSSRRNLAITSKPIIIFEKCLERSYFADGEHFCFRFQFLTNSPIEAYFNIHGRAEKG